MHRRPSRPRPRAAVAAALTVLATLTLAGCSGGDDDAPAPAAAGSSAGAAAPLATRASLGEVVGKLTPARRTQALDGVQEVVDGWLDAAFTAASYPRSDFDDAFPGFTPGAARAAARDLDKVTPASIADRIDGLVATRRTLAVDLLATRGVARTATARVRLDYTTTGDTEVARTVLGRLFLGWDDGWTVFGYDLAQGKTPAKKDRAGSPSGSASDSASADPSPTSEGSAS